MCWFFYQGEILFFFSPQKALCHILHPLFALKEALQCDHFNCIKHCGQFASDSCPWRWLTASLTNGSPDTMFLRRKKVTDIHVTKCLICGAAGQELAAKCWPSNDLIYSCKCTAYFTVSILCDFRLLLHRGKMSFLLHYMYLITLLVTTHIFLHTKHIELIKYDVFVINETEQYIQVEMK